MLTVGEWIDKIHEIADTLEDKANTECANTIQKANAYREGYIQACEEFDRKMKQAVSNEQG